MTDSPEFEGAMGLADFLSDLRAELGEASRRAEDEPLKLRVREVTTTLDVSMTIEKSADASVRAKAKFWVFASAEAGVAGRITAQRVATQRITLALTPRVELPAPNAGGQPVSHPVDVDSSVAAGEENPVLPSPHADPEARDGS